MGSADTRRRITKLSKAREREKVPRLVEYFCVVSSSSTTVDGGTNNNNNGEGGSGWTGVKVSLKKDRVEVVNVEPCDVVNNNSNESNDSNNDNNNNDETRAQSATKPKLDGSEFQPKITARYPTLDHEENPLLSDSIIAFCFPSGKIPIISQSCTFNDGEEEHLSYGEEEENGMPKVHYFVTTGESGQKMYGTCLTVWEPHV